MNTNKRYAPHKWEFASRFRRHAFGEMIATAQPDNSLMKTILAHHLSN